jgi:hypothetical protein
LWAVAMILSDAVCEPAVHFVDQSAAEPSQTVSELVLPVVWVIFDIGFDGRNSNTEQRVPTQLQGVAARRGGMKNK